MALFTKLKEAGLPKMSAKFSKLASAPKLPYTSIKEPKMPSGKTSKSFDFSKFTKTKKLSKAPRVAILKKAIKKVKNVGY